MSYYYDFDNLLTKVILPDASTNEFSYNGGKRRLTKKVVDGTITKFLYDGLNNKKSDSLGTWFTLGVNKDNKEHKSTGGKIKILGSSFGAFSVRSVKGDFFPREPFLRARL